jgi:tetratricopeptide (TPR) repeat protein
VKPLAVVLCDMGLLDRAKAAALLKEIRTERRSGVHETLPLPGLARPRPGDAGKAIRQYAIVRELGKGGMGVVYEAFDTTLKRRVAIKTILDPARADPDALERFRREAQAAARVPHPGIVQVFETGVHEGKPFLVMELVDGESFEALLKREAVPPRRVAEIVRGVALALEHAHAHGVVHRDVKPANVLVDKEGKPRLTDFGLARDEAVTAQLTATGDVLGTPAYMAPEQARGVPGEQGPHTDVYALGGLLYRALTGSPPFAAANAQALLYKVLTQEPVALRRVKPTVHQDLETISLRCLAKEPARRYATAGAVAEDLRRFLEGEAILARPSGGVERALRLVRRNKLLAALLLVAAGASLTSIATVVSAEARADRLAREATVDAARGDAAAAIATFTAALGRKPFVYAGFVMEGYVVSRREILDPGRNALVAAVRFHDLAQALAQRPSVVSDARARRYETGVALGRAAEECDDLATALWAYKDAAGLGDDPDGAVRAAADLEAHGSERTQALYDALEAISDFKSERLERALSMSNEALRLDPRCAPALFVRGCVALREKRFDAALADFQAATDAKPRYAAAFCQAAWAELALGHADRAIEATRRALAIAPEAVETYYMLAKAYRAHSDASLADAAIERGLQLCAAGGPRRDIVAGTLHELRAELREDAGDERGAETELSRAIELLEPDPTRLARRSRARLLLGDRKGAAADLRKLLEIDPGRADAEEVRRRIAQLEAGR